MLAGFFSLGLNVVGEPPLSRVIRRRVAATVMAAQASAFALEPAASLQGLLDLLARGDVAGVQLETMRRAFRTNGKRWAGEKGGTCGEHCAGQQGSDW